MDATPSFTYYTIVLHNTAPQLLLLQDETGRWNLPHWSTTDRQLWQVCDHINTVLKDGWGLETVTLRYLNELFPAQNKHYTRLYELMACSTNPILPSNGRWVDRASLNGLELVHPQLLNHLQNSLLELEQGYPAQRRPWAQRSWFEPAQNWLEQKLAEGGYGPTKNIVQLRTWERSTLWRVQTRQANFYFKAIPPMFQAELTIPQLMDKVLPANFPAFLAAEPEQGWLLMPEFGGKLLEHEANPAIWQAALQQLARIQIAAIPQVPTLLEQGCPNLSLDNLSVALPAFLDALPAYGDLPWVSLSETEIERLQSQVSQLQQACRDLAAYGLPLTLEHGDLWPGNIFINGPENFLFFDWSDATLSHPFFSPILLLDQESLAHLSDDPGLQRPQLIAAYLQPWQVYLPSEDLERAFELAQRLAPLHHALYYHRYILPNMEAAWEMINMVPFYLKMLL